MKFIYKNCGNIALYLLICFFFSGCRLDKQLGDPEQLLQSALSRVTDKGRPSYEGTLKVRNSVIVYENKYNEKSNPIMKIGQIQSLKRKTTIDLKRTNSKVAVLNIEMDPGKMKTLIQTKLRQEQRKLNPEGLIKRIADNAHLSSKVKTRLKSDLSKTVLQADTELNEMLLTLKVKSNYRMWIDRATRLPQKLSAETTMTYKNQGNNQRETVDEHYYFNNNSKIIPQ